MIYKGDLAAGQQVYIENREGQTFITLTSGEHRTQHSSFTTGAWQGAPSLFETSEGIILSLEAAHNEFFLLGAEGIETVAEPPALQDAKKLPLQETDAAPEVKPMSPMKPMEPMPPMKPL